MSEVIFSAYTPTNNPEWLEDTYRSLVEQTDPRWEWVLVPNGQNASAICSKISEIVKDDSRVKVYPAGYTGSVGQLKHDACMRATGRILVELDHDDMLADTCFEEILKKEDEAGFFYSDWTGFKQDGTFETFEAAWGWKSYTWDYRGKQYKALSAFEPTARALCEIFYAPNHVRAWKREAYEKAGGYDASIKVGDDHDLVCRTYLAGAEFAQIKKPLYLYRIHGSNTVKLFNSDIQVQQATNRDKYIHQLVYEEAKRRNLPVLNLGDFTGPPFEVHRVEYGALKYKKWRLPYLPDSVGVVRAFDFLQLVPRRYAQRLIEEVYRVLVPGGWFLTSIPSTDGRGAFQDPRHQSWWNENSWWYWTRKDQRELLYLPAERNKAPKFQPVRIWTSYPTQWHQKANMPYVFADLCALKGQRQPGGKFV